MSNDRVAVSAERNRCEVTDGWPTAVTDPSVRAKGASRITTHVQHQVVGKVVNVSDDRVVVSADHHRRNRATANVSKLSVRTRGACRVITDVQL